MQNKMSSSHKYIFFKVVSDPKTPETSRKPHLLVDGDPQAQRNISETRPEVKKEIPEKVVDQTKTALEVPTKLSETPETVPETTQTDPEEAKKAPVAHEMVPEPPVDVGLNHSTSTPPPDLDVRNKVPQTEEPQQQGRTFF